MEKKMRHGLAIEQPCASAFDADSGATESFSHLGEASRPVLEQDCQVLHGFSSDRERPN
jgi:hypothetical protein